MREVIDVSDYVDRGISLGWISVPFVVISFTVIMVKLLGVVI